LPAEQAVSFLKELWRLCEPTPSSRFEEIDKHLLRMSLAQAYKSTRGLDPKSDVSKYRDWVESKIAKLSLDPAIRKTWVDFLTWKIQPDDPSLLKQAAEVTSLENPDHHIQVIARAALLLRIATGIAGRLLAEAGFTKDQLIFWLEPYAVDHGVLENGGAVSDFLDLWADTEAALRDVSDWESSVTPSYSYGDLVRNIPSQIHRLGESERVFLWGLGI
jgi:hypothetical protein